MYAIIRTGGKQYRVAPGDVLDIENIPAEESAEVEFTDVLAVSAKGELTLGAPTVDGAAVSAEVIEHGRGPKLVVYKKKRRKGYQKKQGHRQGYSRVKIAGISLGGKALSE